MGKRRPLAAILLLRLLDHLFPESDAHPPRAARAVRAGRPSPEFIRAHYARYGLRVVEGSWAPPAPSVVASIGGARQAPADA